MSPRAAARLEDLGFVHVYDYAAGEADWFASGSPRKGKADAPVAGDLAKKHVPTCLQQETVGEVQRKMDESGWTRCVVIQPDRTVIGFVHREKIQNVDEAVSIENVMELGPTTFRFDTSLERATEFMDANEADCVLLTSPEGKLLGLLHRNYAEKTLADTGRDIVQK